MNSLISEKEIIHRSGMLRISLLIVFINKSVFLDILRLWLSEKDKCKNFTRYELRLKLFQLFLLKINTLENSLSFLNSVWQEKICKNTLK